jgi:hypothetical protein
MGQSLLNLYTNPAYARADYRGMVAQIAAENHPNAAIILNAPNQWEVFTYYHDEADAPVYPLPRGFPDPAQLEPELEQIVAAMTGSTFSFGVTRSRTRSGWWSAGWTSTPSRRGRNGCRMCVL